MQYFSALLVLVLFSGCYTTIGQPDRSRSEPGQATPEPEWSDFRQALADNPRARAAELKSASAPVYEEPDSTADIEIWIGSGDDFAAYDSTNGFWVLASRRRGELGYVRHEALEVLDDQALAMYFPVIRRDDDSPSGRRAAYKDPQLATILSFLVPGGGQLYVGDEKGPYLLGLGVGAPLIGSMWAVERAERDCLSDRDLGACGSSSIPPLYVGLGVGVGAWAVGLVSASNDAHDHNRQNGISAEVRPIAGRQNGLAVRVRF